MAPTTKHVFKYLTHNPGDSQWGMYIMVAGSAHINPDTDYPPKGHPAGYNFQWANGRILQEYQINYITDGAGIMETKSGRFNIKAGSVILIHPNVWHRYRPIRDLGWHEHYVGFKGQLADKLVTSSEILRDINVLQIGFHDSILRDFNEIFNEVANEKPGYHQVCSGLVIHILGQIVSIKKNENFSHKPIENLIQKACLILRDSLNTNVNIEQIANNLEVDYSIFRKSFKKYTGLSPMQYHTSLRLNQAKYLLANTDLSIKEISSNLGFCSICYFSKLFKDKVKLSPNEFRKGYNGNADLY